MYKDSYAAVKINNWQLGIGPKPEDLNLEPAVHGWVLSADDELWKEKLAIYDQIEGDNSKHEAKSLYVRKQVDIELGNEFIPSNGELLGNPGSVVRGFLYVRMNANENEPIPSGDWMDRRRNLNTS